VNEPEAQATAVPEETPVALVMVETGGADVCTVDGTGC